MSRKKITIEKKILRDLYHNKGLSTRKIGEIFDCSGSTIINRLVEFDIPFKSPSAARMRYQKKDFNNNNPIGKAYMIGFRIGDLNVYKPRANSETIVVRCHTTHKEQVEVIKKLFLGYGKISISDNKGQYHINCFLNDSFNFLLTKDEYYLRWIRNNYKAFLAFIAGYTDAEGNFILNQNRARFKIDSYDYSVLRRISDWLTEHAIENKFKRICKKGESKYKRQFWNNDLWRLNINRADSLEKFIHSIMPFLTHARRIKHAEICLNNIKMRKKK